MRRFPGFTLIEVVVVLGVMGLISSLMLANFPRFQRQLAVEREASKLALSLRKAQSYALAVREFNSSFNDDPYCQNPPVKFPGYGLFFSMADKTHYFIYGDANCTKYYDSAPIEETVESILIESKASIGWLRGFDAGICSSGCDLTELSILYVRPGPAIFIKGIGADYNYAEVRLDSADGTVSKKVVVRSTGQISVE
ncbi:hypothetical protein A3B19_03190 [Candidatus Giovannonibacteria bacterium RIFCSPLOWO2_01_FULL_46_32]|uniref:Type II secretion system protein GspH n=1 Tax=Candidatus Giovannonibacteria bacterium RIFCSPLOWO2_01_FULL_46_32 TaxID=1798353 RepID=A0A1F5XH00_9BACT|nr:MAG: hypothetical protein A3B19_03190 [Candidatus Giovannonibacteria bacterium RIFCSPLOWO2_01_FULL_46_32]